MDSGARGVGTVTAQQHVELEQKHDIGHVQTLHHWTEESFVPDLNQRLTSVTLHRAQVEYDVHSSLIVSLTSCFVLEMYREKI